MNITKNKDGSLTLQLQDLTVTGTEEQLRNLADELDFPATVSQGDLPGELAVKAGPNTVTLGGRVTLDLSGIFALSRLITATVGRNCEGMHAQCQGHSQPGEHLCEACGHFEGLEVDPEEQARVDRLLAALPDGVYTASEMKEYLE
ncbi:hypothetical protein [Deinococcus sp. SL84]|uniref:hypothetical protein n=1 Tax=Deinococcus sp. SL84 TaxID=2994663 RepID=UPI002275439D|nr:hypothetical protein [Deinococcus sp. SL84]MCY1703849.1 hypothetical protein [Deinococcus sp. SL84]